MTTISRSRPMYLLMAALLFGAGFLLGRHLELPRTDAQLPPARLRPGDGQRLAVTGDARFGCTIPAEGAAIIRHDDGRAYLVTPDGEVEQLSVGDGPRDTTPLRPR